MAPDSPTPAEDTSSDSYNAQITVRGGGNQDQPASREADTLGFKPYVEAVFSYLKNPQTVAPFTLSIEGEWGAGKSSFMFQLEQTLKAQNQKSVKFNAWRHDKVESMWAAFALHFIKELLLQMNGQQRLLANLRLRWHHFDWTKGWFSVFKAVALFAFYIFLTLLFFLHSSQFSSTLFKDDKIKLEAVIPLLGTAGLIIGLLFFLNRLSEVIGNPFKTDLQKFINTPNYEGNVAFIEKFHRDFNYTVNILSGRHDKVFVFVDDLDRADIPKAAELMQGLNMMISNSPKLIFIIGMDREKVAAGVAAKYKDLLPFLNSQLESLTTSIAYRQARDFGYEFLEKFIQLSFQIPKPSGNDINTFIRSLSGKLTPNSGMSDIRYNPVLEVADGEDTRQFQEVTILLAPFFEFNPRRIKQFVNAFRLKAHIAHSTGLFTDRGTYNYLDVLTIPQLGKFIALTMLFPDITPSLEDNPQLFAELMVSSNQGENVKPWAGNKEFMAILNLQPEDVSRSSDYGMFLLNVNPLLETTPAYLHKKDAAATNNERAEPYDDNRRHQSTSPDATSYPEFTLNSEAQPSKRYPTSGSTGSSFAETQEIPNS